MSVSNHRLSAHLTSLSNQSDDDLKRDCAKIILGDIDLNPVDYVTGLLQHGCVSGWVGPLTYYDQTHAFYDRHYDQIEEMRENLEWELGAPVRVTGDLKNFFAWFAFEETVRSICAELEID